AQAVAEFLDQHPLVEWVSYPGLPHHPSYELAQKYLPKGCGAILTFGIKGGAEAGRRLIDRIPLFSHLANVGDAKSLIIHPASTADEQLAEEQQRQTGVTPELIRLSIGLEDVEDLKEALDEGLRAATAG